MLDLYGLMIIIEFEKNRTEELLSGERYFVTSHAEGDQHAADGYIFPEHCFGIPSEEIS